MNKRLWRIIIGVIIFIIAISIKSDLFWVKPVLFGISYIVVGASVVWSAIRNIIRGNVFDENFLMSLATIGAFAIGQYPEGVAVMIFYGVGELFENYALAKSRKSISSLMDIRPDYANLKNGDEIFKVDPNDVHIGDIIVIKPGEKIPVDCTVIDGFSMIDTSSITGEAVPRDILPGNELLSGCININGVLTAEVTKEFGESTVSKILDLVENVSSKKSNSEQFITKFARYYTPVVVILALCLAIIPPLVISGAHFSDWLYRSLSFLVVSCPCALVISIPLSFFGGIGGASKHGILIKGSNYLEALSKAEIVVFDKTGTLTKGVFNVQDIHAVNISEEELLKITAYAESYSNHPISLSIKRAYGYEIDNTQISEVNEIPGQGVSALINSKIVIVGNIKLMNAMNISYYKNELVGTVVHVAIDNKYVGYILISDEIKPDAAKTIKALKKSNIKKCAMLTGDNKIIAAKISNDLGLDEFYAELLPNDKVDKLEKLLSEKSAKGKLVYVGDGINDAPVLARADIGIAMGGLGSDATIEASDIVIMTDEPSKIVTAIKISQKTIKIANQNIVFAIGVKIIVLVLCAVGLATMWAAIFADIGVTIIAVLNAFRALNVKNI